MTGQLTDDNIIRRMRVACWITKAANTNSEYVIHIAFPSQQWLRERPSLLLCTYIASLVIFVHTSLPHSRAVYFQPPYITQAAD
jgi:hypothetical protein